MNEELRRMLEQQENIRRLSDPLAGLKATGVGNIGEVFRLQEEENRQKLIDKALGTDVLKQMSDSVRAATGGTLSELQETMEKISGGNAFSRMLDQALPTGLEGIGEMRLRQDLEERQELIDKAMGKFSAAPRWINADFEQSISAVDQYAHSVGKIGLPWDRLSELAPHHVREALSGLPDTAGDIMPRFGAVTGVALAAVALEERAGLLAAKRDACLSLSVTGAIASWDAHAQDLRVASQGEIAVLAAQAVLSDRLSAYAFGDAIGISSLQARMEAMTTPWLDGTASLRSAMGFAHLQAIGDLIHNAPPYASAVCSWLRTGMGDWRDTVTIGPEIVEVEVRTSLYIDQGFDKEIASTPAKILVRSAAIAQLYEADATYAEDWITATEDDLKLARLAYERLLRFELALREFISQVLLKAFGDKWMRTRLPKGMLDEWQGRHATGAKAGAQGRGLIDYADFTDYLKIIERGDNWREVFAPFFRRKEDIKESLQRLYPVRLATMHGRVVTVADLVLLWSETKRVVSAISGMTQNDSQLPH